MSSSILQNEDIDHLTRLVNRYDQESNGAAPTSSIESSTFRVGANVPRLQTAVPNNNSTGPSVTSTEERGEIYKIYKYLRHGANTTLGNYHMLTLLIWLVPFVAVVTLVNMALLIFLIVNRR